MQVLQDSNGNPVWLAFGNSAQTQTVSVGIGRTNQTYPGFNWNPNPTGYYWVPLPVQVDLSTAFASWTDWLEWDVENEQLWWGKDLTLTEWGAGDLGNGQYWLFYYEEF